jgi:hypothetical protein
MQRWDLTNETCFHCIFIFSLGTLLFNEGALNALSVAIVIRDNAVSRYLSRYVGVDSFETSVE